MEKPTLSKPVMMIILLVIFAIAIGGYILFFQSQKRIAQKDQEYEQLKSKVSQSEQSFNDIQKKNDAAMEQIKQLTKENDALKQTHQEAKAKQDELQAKYDTLLVEHEKLNKELKDKASAPAPAATTPPTTPPAPEKSSSLQSSTVKTGTNETPATNNTPTQPADVPSATITPPSPPADVPSATITPPSPPADVPSATITPPTPADTPPPDPQKSSNLTQPSAKSAGVVLGAKEFQCPASSVVTQHLATGKWSEGDLNWWVDYTRRTLGDNESVQKLFKILFDGQAIACYYELGTDGEEQAFIVVKGSSTNNKMVLKETDGWNPCPTKECEATCANNNLNQCHFKVQMR